MAVARARSRFFHGLDSELANLAQTIVQYVAEIKKPDGERLPGFHDAQLDSLRFRVGFARHRSTRRWKLRG